MTRPNQIAGGEVWCYPDSGGRDDTQWRPIRSFPCCKSESAVAEALPKHHNIEAFFNKFWLLTRERPQNQSTQQTADPQIVTSRTMELKMNRCEPSENTWEAWVAARRRDLAELHRLNTWTNLRRNHELRRAATRKPHPQAPTVAPPRPTTGERQQGGTPTVALEDSDIVEHVQGINESARSWFAESARKAIAQGRQHRPSRHDVATPKSNMRDPDLDVMTLKIV